MTPGNNHSKSQQKQDFQVVNNNNNNNILNELANMMKNFHNETKETK